MAKTTLTFKNEMVKTTLTLTKECKSVVRYDNPDEDNGVVANFYLHKDAYEALGKPKKIEVVVKSI